MGLVTFRMPFVTFRQPLVICRMGLVTFRMPLVTFRKGLVTFRMPLVTCRMVLVTCRMANMTFGKPLVTFGKALVKNKSVVFTELCLLLFYYMFLIFSLKSLLKNETRFSQGRPVLRLRQVVYLPLTGSGVIFNFAFMKKINLLA